MTLFKPCPKCKGTMDTDLNGTEFCHSCGFHKTISGKLLPNMTHRFFSYLDSSFAPITPIPVDVCIHRNLH